MRWQILTTQCQYIHFLHKNQKDDDHQVRLFLDQRTKNGVMFHTFAPETKFFTPDITEVFPFLTLFFRHSSKFTPSNPPTATTWSEMKRSRYTVFHKIMSVHWLRLLMFGCKGNMGFCLWPLYIRQLQIQEMLSALKQSYSCCHLSQNGIHEIATEGLVLNEMVVLKQS